MESKQFHRGSADGEAGHVFGGGLTSVIAVDSGGWQSAALASCPGSYTLSGGSCDMYRGGDGREIGPRYCQPMGNGYYCNEGNGGGVVSPTQSARSSFVVTPLRKDLGNR